MDRAIAIFVFFILAVLAGVLVVPSFIDWNRYRPEIEAYAEDLTGRDVKIGGDISFQLLPTPALTLENFSIANHPDMGSGNMIDLKSVEVLAALRPLILGQLQITDLRLVQPTFAVEILAGDRNNWDLGEDDPRIPPMLKERPWWLQKLADAMRFDNVSVEDGNVSYADGANGVKTIVRKLNAEISAASLSGPVEAIGAANFRGVDVTFEWNSGDTSRIRSVPLRLKMAMKPSGAELAFRGFMDEASLFGPIQGQLSFDAALANDGLNDLFSMINGVRVAKTKGTAAKALSQDLRIETDFSIQGRDLKAANVVMGLNGVRAMGDITGTFGRRPSFAAKLESRSVNLDSLLGETHNTPKSVNLDKAADEIEKELKGFLVPKNINGTIDIAIDGIIYRAGVIQNFIVRGKAADGSIDVIEASGTLPGKAKLKVQGKWTPTNGGTKFAGNIDVATENPRALANWMGMDSASLKSDKLRQFDLEGQVESTPDGLALKDANLLLDGSEYKVSASQQNGDGDAISVSVEGPSLDLDSYRPLLPEGFRGSQWPQPISSPDFELAPEGQDLDVKIDLEDLTWNGSRYEEINAQFSSLDGVLTVSQFDVGNVNGAKIRFSGRGRGTFSEPDFSVRADIKAADLGRFFQSIGVIQGAWVGNVGGHLKIDGALDETSGELALSMVLDGLLNTPTRLEGALSRVDGAYAFWLQRPDAPPPSAFRLDLLPQGDGTSRLKISGGEPNLAAFIASWGLSYKAPDPTLGPLSYDATVTWHDPVAELISLTANLGSSTLEANGQADFSESIPVISGDMTLSDLNLNELLARKPVGPVPDAANSGEEQQTLQAALLSQEVNRQQGALAWFSGLDSNIGINASSIRLNDFVARDFSTRIGTGGGRIVLENLAGTLFGGDLGGEVAYSAADLLPELKGQVGLTSAALPDLQSAVFSLEPPRAPFDGKMDLAMSLSALGRNSATLLATLNGDVELTAGATRLQGLDVGRLKKAVEEATGLDEFRKLSAGAVGTGSVDMTSLGGMLVIEDGRLRPKGDSEQAALSAALASDGAVSGGHLQFSGNVDLNTGVMNGQVSLILDAFEDAPPLKLRLTGPLQAPLLQVESTALGSYFIDDFAKRADQVAKSEMDKQIDLLKSAIDRLDGQSEGQKETPGSTN